MGETVQVKIMARIACPYCDAKARHDQKREAREPDTVRYGCVNGHFFAVPLKDVEVK